MGDKFSRAFPYAFIAFLVVFFLWATLWPKTSLETTINQTIEEQRNRSDIAFKRITLQEIVRGKKFWEMKAELASMNKDLGNANLTSIEGDFLQDEKPILHFWAPKANWDMKEQVIELINPEGFDPRHPQVSWLKSETLVWKLKENLIRSSGKVTVTQDKFTLQSNDLQADLKLKKVRLLNSPVAKINPNRSSMASMEAKEFVYDSATGTFLAQDNVITRYYNDELPAKAITITSDQADFSPREQILHFTGNVLITGRNLYSRADSAALMAQTQLCSLTGNAQLSYQGSQVKGEALTVDLKNNKLTLKGKTKIKIRDDNSVL